MPAIFNTLPLRRSHRAHTNGNAKLYDQIGKYLLKKIVHIHYLVVRVVGKGKIYTRVVFRSFERNQLSRCTKIIFSSFKLLAVYPQ